MLKKKIEECIALTDAILTDYYHGEMKLLFHHLDENCIWIGSCDSEFYIGKRTIVSTLTQQQGDLPMITLNLKEFHCATHDRRSTTIVGRYIGVTDTESGEIFSDRQRVTFSWKEDHEKLFITHMHVSNPLHNLKENEVFPHNVGKYTKKYVKALLRRKSEKKEIISVKDKDNTNHRIQLDEIIFLEAFNVDTLIHTEHGDIYAKMLLSELENILDEKMKGQFVRVHKSFCVNRHFVESIRTYELQMYGGYKIPISRKNYQRIKSELEV